MRVRSRSLKFSQCTICTVFIFYVTIHIHHARIVSGFTKQNQAPYSRQYTSQKLVSVQDICRTKMTFHNHAFNQISGARRLLHLSFAFRSVKESAESSRNVTETSESKIDISLPPLVASTTSSSIIPSNPSAVIISKLRRLKDMMWVRETLEDLTAAEFACSVEAAGTEDEEAKLIPNARPYKTRSKRKRAVDYEKLLAQLDRRIYDLGCDASKGENTEDKNVVGALTPNNGMGYLTYSDTQRTTLLQRLLQTRKALINIIRSFDDDMKLVADKLENELPFKIELPEIRVEIPKESSPEGSNALVAGPKLYVRDDGTVDWDGALQDKAALQKFGKAVWARINGRESESLDQYGNETVGDNDLASNEQSHAKTKAVTAKIEVTPQILEAKEKLDVLSLELRELERSHIMLLTSAISEGQATANVKLASVEPELRNKIRRSDDDIKVLKEKVNMQTLIYELERIYTYLMGELGNPSMNGYIPLQDRLNVAEFGLLESQIDSLKNQLEGSESVDEDVLMVVFDQLTDFKRRLGIDYYVAGLSFDQEAIRQYLSDLLVQTKKGLAFYVKGVQLFWNDLLFCLRLFNRAAQGYTLKPREVRTLRRGLKDIVTFIPFVIILLIPLSPIGHVLVFGAIQRFFPDFFPSCFTEQRQNLLQLYETTEYSEFTINETINEKLSRAQEAFLFMLVTSFKSSVSKLQSAFLGKKSNDDAS